jgi:biopolymer transport protein ExbD/biopolymer transport protein TolR
MLRPRRRARAGLNADINVTSLVDVAFVLLIIFMITAPIMQGGIEVQLPRAAARPLESRQGLVVTIDRRGRIYVDESAMSYADFRATFHALVGRRRPSGIYLRADRGVAYGDVARVLAIIRTSGIANVGLVTEAEDVVR